MNENFKKAEVLSVTYSLSDDRLMLSLKGYPYTMFVDTKEIHFAQTEMPSSGQQKPAILRAGSMIKFSYNGSKVRELKNVILMSDGITEVDDEGKFIKW